MFAEEQISREQLQILQLDRLKKILDWAYDKSAFYQRTFQAHSVTPNDVQSLKDVCKLPLTTRQELIGKEFDLLTLPLSSVIRVSQLDGLTRFYTRADIQSNVELMIRALMAANILRGSIIKLEGDLSDSRLLDVLYALESIGATVVLSEGLDVDTTIKLADDALTLKDCKLYSLPECLFYQCDFGYHVQEDKFLLELVDGELVMTTLTAQAMPLIRYRTGKHAKLIDEPCHCGRSFRRIQFT